MYASQIMFQNYVFMLSEKYKEKISAKWVFAVIALLVVIGVIGYAVYCTSLGGNFAGGIKIGFPTLINVSFNCKK